MELKFKDHLEMMKRGLKNVPNIIEANVNYYMDTFGALPQDKKEEAERRYAICKSCPLNSENWSKTGAYETTRTDLHCTVCQCTIEKKVMSFNESCGLDNIVDLLNPDGSKVLYNWKKLWGPYEN